LSSQNDSTLATSIANMTPGIHADTRALRLGLPRRRHWQRGEALTATGYAAGSVVLSIAGFLAGMALMRAY
jgi:hypothetical protein